MSKKKKNKNKATSKYETYHSGADSYTYFPRYYGREDQKIEEFYKVLLQEYAKKGRYGDELSEEFIDSLSSQKIKKLGRIVKMHLLEEVLNETFDTRQRIVTNATRNGRTKH